MIEFCTGDILKADVEALVNTVNCVGVMGRGVALQFKHAFPENFQAYAAACQRKAVQPGRMLVFETGQLTAPRYIINFPTKRHWRGKSRMDDIEAGLAALAEVIRDKRIRSVAVPPLGSGLGGLAWVEVKPRIEAALRPLTEVRVIVYEPSGAPGSERMTQSREVPTMTAGRAALVELIHLVATRPTSNSSWCRGPSTRRPPSSPSTTRPARASTEWRRWSKASSPLPAWSCWRPYTGS